MMGIRKGHEAAQALCSAAIAQPLSRMLVLQLCTLTQADLQLWQVCAMFCSSCDPPMSERRPHARNLRWPKMLSGHRTAAEPHAGPPAVHPHTGRFAALAGASSSLCMLVLVIHGFDCPFMTVGTLI